MVKKIIQIALVVVILFGAFALGWLSKDYMANKARNASIATAREVAQNVDEDKMTEAYSAADENFKALVPEEDFNQSVSILRGEEGKLGDINEVFSGFDSHLVSFTVVNKDDKSIGTLSLFMVNEDGQWKYRDLNFVN